MTDKATALYRHFDAEGRLLYVGVTSDYSARWRQHQLLSRWVGDVRSTTITWFDDQASAFAAEAAALRAESPKWNVRGLPSTPKQPIVRAELADLCTQLTPLDVERFLSRIADPSPNGCRLWTGEKNGHGYGRFVIWREGRRHRLLAHRVAYFLEHHIVDRPILGLLHSCDTPLCCELTHLAEGTQRQNMADARRRGRTRRPPCLAGEANRNARLTLDAVRTIRIERAAGTASRYQLAERFGVTYDAIRLVEIGETWKSVA